MPELRNLLVAIAVGVLSVQPLLAKPSVRGFEGCPEHFFNGFTPQIPDGKKLGQLRELCFDGFAVLHSGQSKTPVFVAEHLTPARLSDAKGEKRSTRFYAEARLPSAERATLADYEGSGWVRGHMAPAADMPDEASMAQSFSLANMVPQAPKNNSGIWYHAIEKATRNYVKRGYAAYTLTGPLFQAPVRTIGAGQVWIPQSLFKLVYVPERREAWVYVAVNSDTARMAKPMSYADFVALTKTNYLPAGAVRN